MFTWPRKKLKKRFTDMNSATDMASRSEEFESLSSLSETAFRRSQDAKETARDLNGVGNAEDPSKRSPNPEKSIEDEFVYQENVRYAGGGVTENLQSYSDGISDSGIERDFKQIRSTGTVSHKKPTNKFETSSQTAEEAGISTKSNFFKFDENRLRKSLCFVGSSSDEEEEAGNGFQKFASKNPLHKSFSGQIPSYQCETKRNKSSLSTADLDQKYRMNNVEPKKGKSSLCKFSSSACNLGAALQASDSRIHVKEENLSQAKRASYMDIRQRKSYETENLRPDNLTYEGPSLESPIRTAGGHVAATKSDKDQDVRDRLTRLEAGLARMQNELDNYHTQQDQAQSLKKLDNKFEELFVNINKLKEEIYVTDCEEVLNQSPPAPQQKYNIVEMDDEQQTAFCTPVINSDLAHAIFTAVLDRNVRELAIIIVQTEDGFYQLNIVTLEQPERIACLLATGAAVEEARDNGVFDYIPTFRFTCSCCSKGMALWQSIKREMKI